QGTYTTFSYVVIFASIAANLRRREQVERLISAVILSSLPVSLYGVLQRYQIDPIQWGGDVSVRIAANMGNSIFVAAYLIMVFPLTIYRVVESFGAILEDRGQLLANFSRSTAYVFIGALQLIALFFTGSRGPWLGWMASAFFTFVLLSLLWRKRWMTLGIVAVAVLGAGFLVLLNVPKGPLERARSMPGVGRLGQLLDAESPTGRVRTLIWQGAAQLVLPHKPIEYPDGSQDTLNAIRPLIGYGPESMYVAYNSFYPPELAQVEKRNASPDRSHNETWDALVRTGILGLVVYLALFGSVIYYGLKWLGLITNQRQGNLFLGLYLGGGAISATGFVLGMGAGFFGVGLPFGMIIGVLIYLILTSVSGVYQSPETEGERLRALVIMALLAAVVAHFVEINFGIAIAVTRTYFWTFAGLLLVVGYILPLYGEFDQVAVPAEQNQGTEPRAERKKRAKVNRKRRRSRSGNSRPADGSGLPWLREALISSFISAFILVPLGYAFLTSRESSSSAFSVLWSSMVRLPTLLNSSVSYGVLAMVLMAWLFAGILLASESAKFKLELPWGQILVTIFGVSILLGLVYWLWHASGLVEIARSSASDLAGVLVNVNQFENLLTKYYLYYSALAFGLAFFLVEEWPSKSLNSNWIGMIAAPVALILVLYLGSSTNLRVIQADMAFKVADSFSNQGNYPVAIGVYDHAIDLAASEDYYYLFLGRAYLEHGRTLDDAQEREQLISQAKDDLEKAQRLNPLNTDHTANLARLYSLWATFASDPDTQKARGEISSGYFSRATTLSPHNARLWDEWGILFLNILQQPDEAFARISQALKIDPTYDWTHALLGDYYIREVQKLADQKEQREMLDQAVAHYSRALELIGPKDTQLRYSYSLALAGVYAQLNQPEAAISTYEQAIEASPNNADRWQIEEAIGRLYLQLGDQENAFSHIGAALSLAPDDQKERLQALVAQLQAQQ
ncbi:MAG TPA: O-antigen ligase family protein, partial [Anaerolineales bacterium]|nr:O-antigen ligase family protein [Anaerolineales bacterium]